MITRVDPELYLEQMNLAESMVLRIRHLAAQSLFELVLNYANIDRVLAEMGRRGSEPRTEPPPREFIRLLFLDAAEISRNNVKLKNVNPSDIEYLSTKAPNPVLQWLRMSKMGETCSITIGFGTFGDYTFGFNGLAEERRLGRGVPNSAGSWDYFDIADGQRFEFENPFPEDVPLVG